MLEINRKFLTALLEALPSAIYLKDEQGKYLLINENGAKSVGKTVSDFLGKDDNEVFSPALAERTMKLDKQVMESAETYSGEEYAEGNQCFYSHKFILKDEKSGAKVLAGISTDISELKTTELKLFEAQQKAIQANQYKTVFLQSMSHELRTPLNAIIGFSSILAGESGISPEKLLEKTQKYANMIKESGTHLLSIINGLLDLSKIEAGKQDFNEEEIDIGYEIETCLKIL